MEKGYKVKNVDGGFKLYGTVLRNVLYIDIFHFLFQDLVEDENL